MSLSCGAKYIGVLVNYSLYLSSKKILYRGNSMRARAMRKTLRFKGGG
jgi:hypothetical protein